MSQLRTEPAPNRRPQLANQLKLVLACLLMIWLGAVVRRPFLIASHMAADNEKLEQRVMDLKMTNQILRKEAASLDTPVGMEREARRLGYVRKGEVPLVIPRE